MAYKANLHATTNKPLGVAQGVPTDARSYFYDEAQYIYRVYASTDEVLAYLNTDASRGGHFPIFVTVDGAIKEFWFPDDLTDAGLVEKTGNIGKDNYQLWLDAGNVGSYDDFFEASRGPVSTAPSTLPGPAGPPGYPFDIIKILDSKDQLPGGPPTNSTDAYGVNINGAVHIYYYMKGVPGWEDLGTLGNITMAVNYAGIGIVNDYDNSFSAI